MCEDMSRSGWEANRWVKLNYFSISTIHNGMILDCCQLDRALPAIVLMLNMCSFPEQLFKNAQKKSICSTTATYGSMLSNVPLLLLVSMDAICNFFSHCRWNCLCIPVRLKSSMHQSISMNILLIFCSFSWHRKSFRARCLWKSNWSINLRH